MPDFDEDQSVSENIRYFFPVGCKGIDVLIDNSSRLRTFVDPYAHIRLPVTLKPPVVLGEEINIPLNGYILPGPQHIYAPNQLQTAATNPPYVYLPPTTVPPHIYLPPVPESPPNIYLPPSSPAPVITNEIVPPEIPEANCGSQKCCEEAGVGKFVIPIPLKSSGCCQQYAKLILPIKNFDEDSIKKLTSSAVTEIDGSKLFNDILNNLVK